MFRPLEILYCNCPTFRLLPWPLSASLRVGSALLNLSLGSQFGNLDCKTASYIIEGGVCYLTVCEKAYPKKLAYQYLEDLQREFEKVNREQIETVARPYAFIKFGRAVTQPCS